MVDVRKDVDVKYKHPKPYRKIYRLQDVLKRVGLFNCNVPKSNGAKYPASKKEEYKWAFPLRWFDMKNDEAVLIGNEFWELIGGEGTYKNFISEINKLGKEYKERIYREFLEIEPPTNQIEDLLK